MKAQITIQKVMMKPEPEIFSKTASDEAYKTCPYCGQGKIPFKLGVCVCGAQVGDIQYVKNAVRFAKSQYYCYVGESKVEKLGIEELMDN